MTHRETSKQRLDPLILDSRVRLRCKHASTNPSCFIPAAHVCQGVGRFSLDTSGPSEKKKTEPRRVLLAPSRIHCIQDGHSHVSVPKQFYIYVSCKFEFQIKTFLHVHTETSESGGLDLSSPHVRQQVCPVLTSITTGSSDFLVRVPI